MLQNHYKTKSLKRCRYFSFVIPLGSILALLLIVLSIFMVPWDSNARYVSALEIDHNNSSHDTIATNDTTMLASSPSASLTIANPSLSSTGKAGEIVSMSSNVSINAELVNNYTLQIASGNGNGNRTVLEGPTTINSITTATTIDNMEDNTWGYSWDNSTACKGITTTPIALESSNVTTNSINITKPLTFVAKFSKDAIAGHYKAKVNLSLTTTPKALTTYTITYDANGGSGAPGSQNANSYNDSYVFTISSTKPTRSGYEFAGWSTTSTGVANYQPGGTITLQAANPSQTLYAMWKDIRTMNDITYMQDMTSDICTNTPYLSGQIYSAEYTLTDIRDGNTYTARKFNDGRCWTTQNLRITGEIKAEDSDFTSPSSITIPNSISGFNGSDMYQLKGYVSGNTGYYNWYTATAQAGDSSVTTHGTNVNSSICPKNWKLPTGGSDTANSDFGKFATAESIANSSAGSTKIQGSPYNFAYTGYVDSGSLGSTGSQGRWWSRTTYGSDRAYDLYIVTSHVNPGTDTGSRYGGRAVRCIAK